MWCPEDPLWPTTPTFSSTSPRCNCASSEPAEAEPSGATSDSAAPSAAGGATRTPSPGVRRSCQPPPKLSPCSTHSFPGFARRNGVSRLPPECRARPLQRLLPEEGLVRLNQATPAQILAAAERELSLALKRLVGCRNRLYRETDTFPDDLGAAILRLEFLLHHIMAGLVTPARAKTEAAKRDQSIQ